MGAWVNFNGKFKEEGLPLINVDNRGFRYGDGVFETIRAFGERIPLWDLHMARLFRGMNLLGLAQDLQNDADTLKNQVVATLTKNGISGFARVRLTVFGGNGGLFEFDGREGGYLIETWPLETSQIAFNDNGLVLGWYKGGRKSCDGLSAIKSNSHLLYVMAARFAKNQKWNDAVVLNTFERVCESAIANIFWIRNRQVFTPLLSEGCVAGVLRHYLIDRLKGTNLEVTEATATPSEIMEADELFLTNAISGLRWVKQLEEKSYTNSISRDISGSTIFADLC